MKTALCALCLLCAAGAFGQSLGNVAVNSTVQFADHPLRATPQGLGQEQCTSWSYGSVYIEHGEMPLSEVRLPEVHIVPLGDLARAQKKEHDTAKKARVVWEN